jgi:hypothetical protein
MKKHRYMFSNRSAQQAEARKNAAEAQKLLGKWLPPAEPEQAPAPPPRDRNPINVAATQCFRRVSAILTGRGK